MTASTARRHLPRLKRCDVATLLTEVERYLAAVDAFRSEGREVEWRPERPVRRRRSRPALEAG